MSKAGGGWGSWGITHLVLGYPTTNHSYNPKGGEVWA